MRKQSVARPTHACDLGEKPTELLRKHVDRDDLSQVEPKGTYVFEGDVFSGPVMSPNARAGAVARK